MVDYLHLVAAFWTLQGEGAHSGRRALFIRLPFCNLSCSWCDSEFDKFEKVSESDLVKLATQEKARFAVITGGEPLMHKHTYRVGSILKHIGFEIACESNGTIETELYKEFDFVTISPKRQAAEKNMTPYFISSAAQKYASEFKYVVDSMFDFSILDRHIGDTRRLTLSPEWGGFEVNSKKIIDYITRNPQWRISIQTHKILNIP